MDTRQSILKCKKKISESEDLHILPVNKLILWKKYFSANGTRFRRKENTSWSFWRVFKQSFQTRQVSKEKIWLQRFQFTTRTASKRFSSLIHPFSPPSGLTFTLFLSKLRDTYTFPHQATRHFYFPPHFLPCQFLIYHNYFHLINVLHDLSTGNSEYADSTTSDG